MKVTNEHFFTSLRSEDDISSDERHSKLENSNTIEIYGNENVVRIFQI